MTRYTTAFCAAAALALATGAGHASTLTLTDISAAWVASSGGSAVTTGSSGSTAQLRWGNPTDDSKSGYDFTPTATPLQPAQETDFDLGTFTHLNFPIELDTGIDEATLDVFFTFYLGEDSTNLFTRKSRFVFDHWETTNNASPCADGGQDGAGVNVNGCADRVRATNNPSRSETFEIVEGGVTQRYFFSVSGFDIGSDFWTTENAENTARLRGRYTHEFETQPAPVPLPAAGWLLLAGVGGLVAAGRRSKAG